ncbi:MAG: radical SAM/SPASM domain-containing protein [Candidatus Binatia bacterium]
MFLARLRRAGEYPVFLVKFARLFFRPPRFEGTRLTPKRLWNLYKLRWAQNRCRTVLRSYPAKLTLEPTSVCNLECPACFTGSGEVGRARSPISLDLYRRLLAELGDYLLQVEFFNWGEPLLAKHIMTMVHEASTRGISTVISTNFSFPFDANRAEQLVRAGLAVLGVSIDGAHQEVYAQYRVGGNLATVLRNCALVLEARRRLGSSTPRLVWEYHVFPHNTGDIEAARAKAAELGMDFALSKGWVIGPDWDPEGRWAYPEPVLPFPCTSLWHSLTVNNDGGVSPCCGTFYREDDVAQLPTGAGTDGPTVLEVWNSPRFQAARRLYRDGTGRPEDRHLVCHDCPQTVEWERYKAHLATGAWRQAYRPSIGGNARYNYFWNRRPGLTRR